MKVHGHCEISLRVFWARKSKNTDNLRFFVRRNLKKRSDTHLAIKTLIQTKKNMWQQIQQNETLIMSEPGSQAEKLNLN